MPPFVNGRAMARALGVSHQAVAQAAKRGRIPRRPDKKYDVPVVMEAWTSTAGGLGAENGRHGRGQRQGNGGGEGGANFYAERAMREQYLGLMAKLDYEERMGQLVSAEEVRATAFAAGRRLRERLESMADRIATLVAGSPDRAKCHKIVMTEVNRALDELADDQEGQ